MARSDVENVVSEIRRRLPAQNTWKDLFTAPLPIRREELYRLSYPEIIGVYARGGKKPGKGEWALRIVCVSGWLRTVLQPTINDTTTGEANRILTMYEGSRLWELPGDSPLFTTESLSEEVLNPIAELISQSQTKLPPISSLSKLLHFALPDLFPIMDKRIANSLSLAGKKTQPSVSSYAIWMRALRAVIKTETSIVTVAESIPVSPVRLAEWLVFVNHGK